MTKRSEEFVALSRFFKQSLSRKLSRGLKRGWLVGEISSEYGMAKTFVAQIIKLMKKVFFSSFFFFLALIQEVIMKSTARKPSIWYTLGFRKHRGATTIHFSS